MGKIESCAVEESATYSEHRASQSYGETVGGRGESEDHSCLLNRSEICGTEPCSK
jgi:hypothetical protein